MANMTIKDNKKGGILGYSFFLICFIFIWAIWLGNQLSAYGEQLITEQSLTGYEAFFYANLNIWIALSLFISTFLYIYFGGRTA